MALDEQQRFKLEDFMGPSQVTRYIPTANTIAKTRSNDIQLSKVFISRNFWSVSISVYWQLRELRRWQF